MLASTIILVILCAVLPAFMAPTRKPDVPLASDFVGELKKFQSQLRPLQDEFKKILQAVEKGTHERSEKNEEHHEDAEKHKKEEKDEEEDDFISRVAEKVAGKLSIEDPSAKIQRLVNLTSHRLIAKMNASHDNVYEFKSKLLGAVIKILNERALKYEPPVNKSLPPAPKGVDERKVVQALEELLEGPLISGFVSQEQERKMIRSAIIALSKDFGISKSTTKDIIETMIHHVEQDVKSLSESNGKNTTAQPMSDEEKILGLEKMVEDKVTENNLNLDEMKYLVKGLAAAVGARNNLSEEQTKHLEEKIRKGVYEFFAKNKIPKNEASEISQLIDNKNVPEGFREAQEKKDEAKDKRSFEVEKEDGNLSALLEDLEKKWNEEKKSSVEAKKQKQYLKEILSNSLALMESLETEQKQRRNESQRTSQIDEKEHRKEIQTEEKGFRKEIQTEEKEHRQEILADEKEHRKGIQTEKEHRKAIEKEEKEHRMEIQSELKDHRQEIEGEEKEYAEKKAHGESEKQTLEPTKQATNKPTNSTKENGRTTEEQSVQSHSTKPMEKNGTSQPMEKTNVTSQDQKQPIEKRDGISDDMAKEIEEAEAEIQREIEIQQRKEEKKMMELEEEKNEKEKAKEKKQIIPKPEIIKDKMNEAEKELEKELKEQENKQKEKLKVNKEEINAAEKEIEKELEEQAKALKSKVTTATPATTKKNNAETNNELIRQLDDLFQDS